MDRCKFTSLLILDDLGAQRNTDWALEQLDSLIDHRYVCEKLTIFTTNLTSKQLPARIASRLNEGECIKLTCCDYRELKARRRIENMEAVAEAQKITGVKNENI